MMKRKLSLLLLAAFPALVSAEDCCMPEYLPAEPLCDGCAGYSQYAGIQLECGWDVFAYGEFLYWRPFPNTVWVAVEIPPDPFTQTQKSLSFTHSFRPGFRVGLGMRAHGFDDWIFNIDYFRYHQSFHKTMTAAAPNFLASDVYFLGSFGTSIRNGYDFEYDIVGLNMARPNYLGQRVILSPFFGLKWLNRDVTFSQDLTDFGGGINRGKVNMKYTSIGLAAGFDGSWLLCWGLSLIGTADVAALYAYDRSLHDSVIPAIVTENTPIVVTKNHIRHLDIYAKGGFGLSWGSYLCCRRYHAGVSATFDYMVDVVKMDDLCGGFGNGETALMGLSIRGQFDF